MAASMSSKVLLSCFSTRVPCRFARSCRLVRNVHCTSVIATPAYDKEFEAAKTKLNSLKEDPGNEVKLQMYGLFKQATVGKCNTPKPGMMDMVGKVKWGAWNTLGDMSRDEAQKKYIELVNELAGAVAESETPTQTGKYSTLIVERDGKTFKITLNRPSKKNAITYEMYSEWVAALEEAAQDKSVTIAVITGAGDFFCSGNDLSNFANINPAEIGKMANQAKDVLMKFVTAFIDFPKPLIGLINGPAVGVSVTTLGLYDAVYASDRATFHTPFSHLGQSPEGCSSYIFPRLMGLAKANEMLLFNKKLTALEAFNRNLVTEIIPEQSFVEETDKKMKMFSELPPLTMQSAKNIIRSVDRETLHKVCERECNLLVERWQHPECMNAIMNFFTRKSNT
ncbi:enoyl-CoA delta isomerase 2-like [Gigantopelta aegis]|uniref:enoyl-CoA delta isomerase 2-like n=1 Tax=Gigantopelta aegis TaxID=1735272 RepID=UPI001B88D41E|nr:enoyl-CoA delta isomerase 2-like [Gigantopelta aegis]